MRRLALVLPLALAGAGGPVMAEDIETPDHEVVERLAEDIEVRRYAPRLAAETVADGSTAAFRRLFDYISGANAGGAKVEMTAPVETAQGAEIAMTAPVETTPAEGEGVRMRFFLPAEYDRESAPAPSDPEVRLVAYPARTEAVLRYSGLPLEWRAAPREERLREAVAASGWQAAGPAVRYYYDPPWTLPWSRRNEVALPVERGE